MQPLRRAKSHQLVVGRVVINPVDSAPLRIESAKAWRIVVGEAREIGSASAAGNPAEGGKILCRVSRTLTRNSLAQNGIRSEQVYVSKGRALIEHLLSRRNWIGGHGFLR
jgi:hypothetical protein